MNTTDQASRPRSVSVVIPTFNNERTIRSCLEAAHDQTRPPDEILVVDGGSGDGTLDIARELGTLIESPVANRCYQQNLGADKAIGDYLLFLDADMAMSEHVIEEAISSTTESRLRALVLPEVSYGSGFWAHAKAFERSFYDGIWWIEAARWISRDVFLSVGGFDVSMTGTEDWDLDERLRKITKVGRIEAPTYHDEGKLSLFHVGARKAHYSVTFEKFCNTYSARAGIVMSPKARARVFLRKPLRLARHPFLTAGIVALGLVEIGATRGWYRSRDPWPEERPMPERSDGTAPALSSLHGSHNGESAP